MPLPPMDATPEEIAALGWFKTVDYEWVSVEANKIIYRKIRFVVSKIGHHGLCSRCNDSESVFLHTMPTGVYRACLICGITCGPLPTEEDKRPVGETLIEKQITEKEAFETLLRTNQPVPLGLRPRMRRS